MATLRAFIAVPLSSSLTDRLKQIQDDLRMCNADVKWVEPTSIHLTLKFLGNIKEKSVQPLAEQLAFTLAEKKSFDITITELGAFPSIIKPRVIWVGMGKGAKETSELARIAEEAAGLIGIGKEERPFSPHVTLGRVRSFKNLAVLSQGIENYVLSSPPTERIQKVVLFKSTLTGGGPVYEPLQEIKLQ